MAVAALDGVKLDLSGQRNVLAPDAAERWLYAIDAEIFAFGRFPKRCPWAGENGMFRYELRHLVFSRRRRRCRVIFTIYEDTVHVLHVRHGARPSMTKAEIEDLLPPI